MQERNRLRATSAICGSSSAITWIDTNVFTAERNRTSATGASRWVTSRSAGQDFKHGATLTDMGAAYRGSARMPIAEQAERGEMISMLLTLCLSVFACQYQGGRETEAHTDREAPCKNNHPVGMHSSPSPSWLSCYSKGLGTRCINGRGLYNFRTSPGRTGCWGIGGCARAARWRWKPTLAVTAEPTLRTRPPPARGGAPWRRQPPAGSRSEQGGTGVIAAFPCLGVLGVTRSKLHCGLTLVTVTWTLFYFF